MEKETKKRNDKGDLYSKYNIEFTKYTNVYGESLWEEPFYFGRLHGAGDSFISGGIYFEIRRVAILDNTEIINLETKRTSVPWGEWKCFGDDSQSKEEWLSNQN